MSSADVKSTPVAAPAEVKTEEKKVEKKFVTRAINMKVLSVEQSEGVGARVRRSIGGYKLRNFDPFLMLDEFRVAPPAGFPDHPHRGFETVTLMLSGSFNHEDFCGHKGTIGPGDLQWMTAGKGIVHAEVPASKEVSHGLQLWVNLFAKDKMCAPAYQELKCSDIPTIEKNGVWVKAIAGESLGIKSPVYTRTPVHYLHFKMKPNSHLQQPIDPKWNAFAYTLSGEVYFGGKGQQQQCEAHYTVTFTQGADGIEAFTLDKPAEFVLLSGQPTGEPVLQHGPFVMNTPAEIRQAIMDFSTGRNGFEKAPGFQSAISAPFRGRADDDEDY